ncbi:SDR family oxidoreductase [Iodidimonas sp. SYSU 1G8]|uniref:SDR family NAD(P)-dependent oxidoreductase n=1 Tax=Iodidimonas sp. SYSU 1G8 TaxID=3133967 RepID=UPI0031FED3E2
MKNLFDLTGKVALVTGGNGGIGIGMAEGLAMHGASVVIWGTNAEKNARAVERLKAHGGEVRAAVVDVSDEAAVKAGMADILKEFGRIDQAIANAGISIRRKDLFDISLEDFQKMEGINLHGVLFTLREAARSMIERHKAGDGGGSLVGIASTAAIHGAARNEHYAATKGAVVTMCRAMAVELARHRISVNSICPGWVRSEMTAGAQAWDKFNENVISRVPTGGWADGEDFSAIAVYLASNASRYHTGDTLVIDGAYTIY